MGEQRAGGMEVGWEGLDRMGERVEGETEEGMREGMVQAVRRGVDQEGEFRECPVPAKLRNVVVWVTAPTPNTPFAVGVTPDGQEWSMWSVERPRGSSSYTVLGGWMLGELRWYKAPRPVAFGPRSREGGKQQEEEHGSRG